MSQTSPQPEADAPAEDVAADDAAADEAGDEEPATEASTVTTVFAAGDDGWDPKRDGERRNPTTAEQAVPWLIGLVLALAGMVIILVALIFSGPQGLVGATSSPTATPGHLAQRLAGAHARRAPPRRRRPARPPRSRPRS